LAAGQSGFGAEEIREDKGKEVWIADAEQGYTVGLVKRVNGDKYDVKYQGAHGNWEEVRFQSVGRQA
jgi:hypothetical protein